MTAQLDLFTSVQANAEQDAKTEVEKYLKETCDYAQKESKGFDYAMFVCIDSEDYHIFITSVPHLHKCKPYAGFIKGKPIVITKNLPA